MLIWILTLYLSHWLIISVSDSIKMVSPPVMPINSRNVMHNTKSLNFSRTSLSVLAGGVAGILGLTSFLGILFYFLASGILGVYYMINDTRNDSLYFMNKQQLITAFVFENLFTYILMWTLMYGCVHVYWTTCQSHQKDYIDCFLCDTCYIGF